VLDDIFNFLFGFTDTAGTVAGSESKSKIIRIAGLIIWILLFIGIAGMISYWLK
jgi:hypothetical protein